MTFPRGPQSQFSSPGSAPQCASACASAEATCVADEVDFVTAPELLAAQRNGCGTVAVLDDEDEAAASICECLALRGFKAMPFTDPLELLTMANSQPVDAFVLDWWLGHQNSSRLIESLRASPTIAGIPMFILTGTYALNGRPTDPALIEAIKTHGLHYRRKPLPCPQLADDLLRVIELHCRVRQV